jgi:hypothetical protein
MKKKVVQYSITSSFVGQNIMSPTGCTFTHQRLSNNTKSMAKRHHVILGDLNMTNKTNKQPSFIDR